MTNIDANEASMMFGNISDILNQYYQCYGYEIIWCDFVKVKIPRYNIVGQKETLEKFNMVENAIFALIDDQDIGFNTVKSIADFLELNQLIVKYYVNDFLRNGMLTYSSVYNQSLVFSSSGKDAYKNGYKLHKVEPIDISVYCKNDFCSLCGEQENNYDLMPYRDLDLMGHDYLNYSDAIQILKRVGIFEKGSSYSIELIKQDGFHYIPCVIIYLYDLLNDDMIYLAYNINDNVVMSGDIADSVLNYDKRFVFNEAKYIKRINNIKDIAKIEKEQSIDNIYSNKRNNQDNIISIERYYDSLIIREKFLQCFKNAEKTIIIQCPWIKNGAIDSEFLNALQDAVNREIYVFIQYGIDTVMQNESSSLQSIQNIENVCDKSGVRRVFVIWTGNNHTKEVVVDDKYDLFGSFNFLSFNPNNTNMYNGVIREEGMEIIHDKDIAKKSRSKYLKSICTGYLSNLNLHNISAICALWKITHDDMLFRSIDNFIAYCNKNDIIAIVNIFHDYNFLQTPCAETLLKRIFELYGETSVSVFYQFLYECIKENTRLYNIIKANKSIYTKFLTKMRRSDGI